MPKSVKKKIVITGKAAVKAVAKKSVAAVKRVFTRPTPVTVDTPGACVRVTTYYTVKRSPAGSTTPGLVAVEDPNCNRVLTFKRSELELVGDGR